MDKSSIGYLSKAGEFGLAQKCIQLIFISPIVLYW